MMIQAWQVSSLPPVECYLPPDLAQWTSFSHISTRVRGAMSADDGRAMGDTVWGGVRGGRDVALAWDWIEILPGVVCLLDPNSITTNVRFLDENDCYQEPLQAIISANRLAYLWPWQQAVLMHLSEAATAPGNQVTPRARTAPSNTRVPNSRHSVELRRAA
jgi:hypothetical protein